MFNIPSSKEDSHISKIILDGSLQRAIWIEHGAVDEGGEAKEADRASIRRSTGIGREYGLKIGDGCLSIWLVMFVLVVNKDV